MEQGQAGQFTYSLYAVSFHDARGGAVVPRTYETRLTSG